MVAGMPDSCQREVIRPDPNEALLQNQDTLTDAFFDEPPGRHRITAAFLPRACS